MAARPKVNPLVHGASPLHGVHLGGLLHGLGPVLHPFFHLGEILVPVVGGAALLFGGAFLVKLRRPFRN